jgi:hypothetical protein
MTSAPGSVPRSSVRRASEAFTSTVAEGLGAADQGPAQQPSVGTKSSGWKQALQAFTIYFEGRIPTP